MLKGSSSMGLFFAHKTLTTLMMNYSKLGAFYLSGLKFIQFNKDLIVTQASYHSHSIKKRATMSKFVLNAF
jgi:hypothetical protein